MSGKVEGGNAYHGTSFQGIMGYDSHGQTQQKTLPFLVLRMGVLIDQGCKSISATVLWYL